jgi:2-keto-4-pentenoate hydratase/2-oxohepta-3-ene-1,7-dioic acid hydratase in catechol pathway
MVVWNRLIRFEANDGHIYFGEPILKDEEDIASLAEFGKLKAVVLAGDDVFDPLAQLTSNVQNVKTLLGPLTASQVPIIRCVGLNYLKHIKEGGRSPPPYPSIFIKPADCVADHGCVVHVPKLAQDQCDYEGELVS